MIRRGPDDSGMHEEPGIVLGHRRLSILVLTSTGRQPMSRADGRLWILNYGEIYNFQELRHDMDSAH